MLTGENDVMSMNGPNEHNATQPLTDAPKQAKVAPTPRTFKRRWFILFIFVSLSLSNAFQWIEYAIIANIVRDFYDIPWLAVDWTSMIYMFAYIPLIWPAAWVLDKYGLRLVGLLGAFGNCLGAWIKCASAHPSRFPVTFLGQTIAGASQIFILGLPPRLAAVWFGPNEVSTACALGVFGNQLGIAIGFLIPPMIVRKDPDPWVVADGFQTLFFISAAINSAIFLLILGFFKDSPPVPPSPAQMAAIESTMDKNFFHSLKLLLKNLNFVLLVITYGLNVGAFYAISTLLNQMVGEFFPDEEVNIGRIGLLIVLAGMLGSVISGIWLDKTKKFKLTTVLVYLFSCIGMVVYAITIDKGHLWVVFVCAGALGFFMTGYLPLGFEFGAELTYPVSEGTTSGILNVSCQIFGMIETLSIGFLLNHTKVWVCNTILCIILALGTILTCFIKSDLRRHQAGQSEQKKSSYSEGVITNDDSRFIQSDSNAKIIDNEMNAIELSDFPSAEEEVV